MPVETPLGTRFTYEDKFAKQVTLVGDFNNWNPKITKFKQNRLKLWEVLVPLKRGSYSYKINVDGQWIIDPINPRRVSNDLGDERSVITIEEGSDYYLKQFGWGLREASAPQVDPRGIVFSYKNMNARFVYIAGTFNGWDKSQYPLRMNDNGVWSIRFRIPKGTYQYKYFVDNIWIEDPNNPGTEVDQLGQKISQIKISDDFIETNKRPHPIDVIPYKFKYYNAHLPSKIKISVIGSFNDWDETLHVMSDPDQDKVWECIAYLKPGNYYYRFKVRNEVFLDPYNTKQKKWEDGQPASFIEIFQPPERKFIKFVYKNTKNRDIQNISIVGDFNNWTPNNNLLEWDVQNKYWYTIIDLPTGKYKYRYFINDNIWENDTSNPDNAVDKQGVTCSLVLVGITNRPKLSNRKVEPTVTHGGK